MPENYYNYDDADYDDVSENNSDEENEEPEYCPLCMEEFDLTDKNFTPCPCGYQICIWCWNKIKDLQGRCPACRRQYEASTYKFTRPDKEMLEEVTKKKKRKEKSSKQQIIQSRKHLANVRVIQRNLVYVVGLTPAMAKEEIIREYHHFGQYGPIAKVVIHKSQGQHGHHNNPSAIATANALGDKQQTTNLSAYITYVRREDAYTVIKCVDGAILDGKVLRCSFGTTKYCSYFIRGVPCVNPDCMYLHDLGDEEDTFSKEDMIMNKALFQAQIHPINNPPQAPLPYGLPPPPRPESTTSGPAASVVVPAKPDQPMTIKIPTSSHKSVWKLPANTSSSPAINTDEWPTAAQAASGVPSLASPNIPQPKSATSTSDSQSGSTKIASAGSILPSTATWAKAAAQKTSDSEGDEQEQANEESTKPSKAPKKKKSAEAKETKKDESTPASLPEQKAKSEEKKKEEKKEQSKKQQQQQQQEAQQKNATVTAPATTVTTPSTPAATAQQQQKSTKEGKQAKQATAAPTTAPAASVSATTSTPATKKQEKKKQQQQPEAPSTTPAKEQTQEKAPVTTPAPDAKKEKQQPQPQPQQKEQPKQKQSKEKSKQQPQKPEAETEKAPSAEAKKQEEPSKPIKAEKKQQKSEKTQPTEKPVEVPTPAVVPASTEQPSADDQLNELLSSLSNNKPHGVSQSPIFELLGSEEASKETWSSIHPTPLAAVASSAAPEPIQQPAAPSSTTSILDSKAKDVEFDLNSFMQKVLGFSDSIKAESGQKDSSFPPMYTNGMPQYAQPPISAGNNFMMNGFGGILGVGAVEMNDNTNADKVLDKTMLFGVEKKRQTSRFQFAQEEEEPEEEQQQQSQHLQFMMSGFGFPSLPQQQQQHMYSYHDLLQFQHHHQQQQYSMDFMYHQQQHQFNSGLDELRRNTPTPTQQQAAPTTTTTATTATTTNNNDLSSFQDVFRSMFPNVNITFSPGAFSSSSISSISNSSNNNQNQSVYQHQQQPQFMPGVFSQQQHLPNNPWDSLSMAMLNNNPMNFYNQQQQQQQQQYQMHHQLHQQQQHGWPAAPSAASLLSLLNSGSSQLSQQQQQSVPFGDDPAIVGFLPGPQSSGPYGGLHSMILEQQQQARFQPQQQQQPQQKPGMLFNPQQLMQQPFVFKQQ